MNSKRLGRFSWVVGFLGFIGLLGLNHSPTFYLFFAFFGGFQYYWWFKLGQEDERLAANKGKAAVRAFGLTFALGFVVLLAISYLALEAELLYELALIIFALTFALSFDLWALITYKLDVRG
ncbi:DUF3796 domain-containing protein [Ligilactobacillus acidipiscis]|uniref:DUF3796 domain-containing protein n=1 Tax=Ligilactobacillus acidipiscis TaxID=89059 RepID=UPI0022E0E4DC|nr:DUF3796 domain-containing protein [Ligilactobacillus acidipiscis]